MTATSPLPFGVVPIPQLEHPPRADIARSSSRLCVQETLGVVAGDEATVERAQGRTLRAAEIRH
jgi:hypothetical protein